MRRQQLKMMLRHLEIFLLNTRTMMSFTDDQVAEIKELLMRNFRQVHSRYLPRCMSQAQKDAQANGQARGQERSHDMNAGQTAGSTGSANAGSNGKDDDVIDADFKEV